MPQGHKLLLLAACTVLILPIVTGFGYLPGETQKTVLPGDKTQFTVYIFAENGTTLHARPVNAPDTWNVMVVPRKITFPVTSGYRQIPTDNGYTRAVPVHISVESPVSAEPGTYPVTVEVAEEVSDGRESRVTVAQRQDFRFNVRIPGTRGSTKEAGDSQEQQTRETSHANETNVGGQGLAITEETASSSDADDGTEGRTHLALLLLFELVWGIAVLYIVKRRW